jgi:hypothetical protein
MLLILGFLLFITLAFLVLLLPALTAFEGFKRHSGSRAAGAIIGGLSGKLVLSG